MNDEFTPDKLEKLEYAVVEVSSKRDKDKKVEGYFLGMRNLANENIKIVGADEIFLWLLRANHIYVMSLSHYNVDVIEMKTGNSTYHLRCVEMDQKVSKDRLNAMMTALQKSKQVLYNGLVDTSTYKGMSLKLKEKLKGLPDSNKINSGSNTNTNKNKNSSVNNRSSTVNYTTYKKKEVKTTLFHRTTRYVIAKAIGEMKEKIQLVREGIYEAPPLKKLDIEKETASANKKSDDDDDDMFYGYGYHP